MLGPDGKPIEEGKDGMKGEGDEGMKLSTGELVLAIVGPAILIGFVVFIVTFLIMKSKAAAVGATGPNSGLTSTHKLESEKLNADPEEIQNS